MKRRNDGRYAKSKNINGKRVFFYSSEPTERKALKDIENTPMSFYILNGLISISKLTLELTAYILSKYFKASNTLLSKRYLIII